ncbi:hypothetical protein GOODEAATRI_018220, partial [Goodea atripinnis]
RHPRWFQFPALSPIFNPNDRQHTLERLFNWGRDSFHFLRYPKDGTEAGDAEPAWTGGQDRQEVDEERRNKMQRDGAAEKLTK